MDHPPVDLITANLHRYLPDVLHRLAGLVAGDYGADSVKVTDTAAWLCDSPPRVITLLYVADVLAVEAGCDPSTLRQWAAHAAEAGKGRRRS